MTGCLANNQIITNHYYVWDILEFIHFVIETMAGHVIFIFFTICSS